MTEVNIKDSENKEKTVTINSDDDVQVEFHQEKVTVSINNKITDQDLPF